jgi:ATP adenylyltransferase
MTRETVQDVEDIVLPADLEERTNVQFDDMVSKGRIFYDQQTEPGEVFVDDGFLVSVKPASPLLCPSNIPGEFHVYRY